MIITRTPFRVSFLGGGTDVPWFYEENGGGSVLSLAVDLHMYISCHPLFESEELLLKYSQIERVNSPQLLRHPIAREVLSLENVNGLDIGVSADVPAGTGLGSSSAFTVGLLNAVATQKGQHRNKQTLAEQACDIEINKLEEPIGKQDQFAASFGGFNHIKFLPSGETIVSPIPLNREQLSWLAGSLLLVRVDDSTRSASQILKQQKHLASSQETIVRSLLELRSLTDVAAVEIAGDITKLGHYVGIAWELKKKSNPWATNSHIDQIIDKGLEAGASSGKLLGAGGGGFVLLVCNPDTIKSVSAVFNNDVCVQVRPDFAGTTVIYSH